jgi:sugar O-acyltransferase (sialic acid O-acetyltransferase NeuD family)
MARRKLIIVGDSSFAEVACEMFDAAGDYEPVGFTVHRQYLRRRTLLDRPVHALEDIERVCPATEADAFVAVAYRELNRVRTRLCAEVKGRGYRLATYVSPHALVWRNVSVGENCFIFEGNVLQPFVGVGNNVILWSGNHIGHHSVLEDNIFVASHVVISGHCHIGANSFLGVNAAVADTVTIGADNWIGPNVLITKDTKARQVFRTPSTGPSAVDSFRFLQVRSD